MSLPKIVFKCTYVKGIVDAQSVMILLHDVLVLRFLE
jgi:hypothetical protein